jgi:cyd operon protein YbgT
MWYFIWIFGISAAVWLVVMNEVRAEAREGEAIPPTNK